VPTVLAGFKSAIERLPNLPLVIAVNSDESMRKIGKKDFEKEADRALKVAIPLAKTFPELKVIVMYYDEETPNELYQSLHRKSHTRTLQKWGYGTDAQAPKIEGAELFDFVYAYPLANDVKPICWHETPQASSPQQLTVIDLRDKLIAKDGVLFELPQDLAEFQSATLLQKLQSSFSK